MEVHIEILFYSLIPMTMQSSRPQESMRTPVAVAVVVFAVIIAGVLYYYRHNAPRPTGQGAASNSQTMPAKTTLELGTETRTVTASNSSFSPKELYVKKGDKIVLTLTGKEGTHDWTLAGYNNVHTDRVAAGQSTTVTFTADKAGTFEYYCSLHQSQGMKGKLIVVK